ncbi:hypothetical protein CAJAP_08045 [Camponotus japonicus]
MGGMVRQTSPLWGVPKDILPTDRIAAARALLAGYVIVYETVGIQLPSCIKISPINLPIHVETSRGDNAAGIIRQRL